MSTVEEVTTVDIVGAIAEHCACGHMILVHHLTPKGRRAYCTHMDADGPCRCDKAEVADA